MRLSYGIGGKFPFPIRKLTNMIPPLLLEKSFLRSMKSFVRLLIEFVSRIRINIVPPNTRNIFISWMDVRISRGHVFLPQNDTFSLNVVIKTKRERERERDFGGGGKKVCNFSSLVGSYAPS